MSAKKDVETADARRQNVRWETGKMDGVSVSNRPTEPKATVKSHRASPFVYLLLPRELRCLVIVVSIWLM